MYFPIGWPKLVDTSIIDKSEFKQICCDRVKILLAILANDHLGIWYTKPLVPIVYSKRNSNSVKNDGANALLAWKPDSSMLVVATTIGNLLLYTLEVIETPKGVFNQVDPPHLNLRRDSAELFVKETVPALSLKLAYNVPLYVPVTSIVCVSITQIMVSTKSEKIIRIRWDGSEERDYTVDLKRIPFSINQQASYAVPITEPNVFVISMEYSPLVGGFAITFNDGRAAFLTASNLKFDPNQVQGVWADGLDDATCCSINHKFRLLAFGRKNSQAAVYTIEDSTGGLEISHRLVLSAKDFPGSPGAVNDLKWTPDGCAVVMSWNNGGISVWSTFGTMLMCSLGWDYGLHTDLSKQNPLSILTMEWSTEGYQLFLLNRREETDNNSSVLQTSDITTNIKSEKQYSTEILQLDFVKSTLAVNPCMASYCHILLQGDDKLYINQGNSLEKIYFNSKFLSTGNQLNDMTMPGTLLGTDDNFEVGNSLNFTSMLAESKHWIVLQLPVAYACTNWPIRYTAIDDNGLNIAVAGRTGLAHYSMTNRKWKLFGNETQEKDFVATGGLLWWKDFIVIGCFSLIDRSDEIRFYPKECKLDNQFAHVLKLKAPVLLINLFRDQLIVFSSDGIVSVFQLFKSGSNSVEITSLYEVDIRRACTHPACIVSVTMTNVKNEIVTKSASPMPQAETIILNVSGRILMIQRDSNSNSVAPLSTCLASCVECIWLSNSERSHMKGSLWLYCGNHGMRVWLPVLPCEDDIQRSYRHTFMSKRIMLSFNLKLYPLAILFEDVIILGVENDTVLYTSDSNLHFSIPFCVLEKKSQVYLHQVLRQLIRRNLGYNAWEIARCCTNLPYYSHSLELLLHEVLEDEATSKEPIPDALLPSVLEFIQEFPVYLQTIVQCARKTEIALWPYLFATAGKPKELFQQCLSSRQLETAASYLIILQNLEPSAVSRQYATLLLDTALENKKWDLAKDLVRFLRAIDPNDVESPRSSFILNNKFCLQQQSQSVNPDAEDLSLILGTIARGRSFSTSVTSRSTQGTLNNQNPKEKFLTTGDTDSVQRRKKSLPNTSREKNSSHADDFFIEVILQRHARRLLQDKKLEDLGYMSAALDFHLVTWLVKERDRAARIEDFVLTLNQLHYDLNWPKPNLELSIEGKEQFLTSQQESPIYSVDSPAKNKNVCTLDSGYASLPRYIEDGLYNSNSTNENNSRSNSISFPIDVSAHQNRPTELFKPHMMSNVLPSINEELTRKPYSKCGPSTPRFDVNSTCSEEVSVFDNEVPDTTTSELYYTLHSDERKIFKEKKVPHRLNVKIRYLLHIFTEANCLEYSLVLSILLLDAASVSRITNSAIRSGSLSACRQIRNALKDITRWSFHECLGYRSFMMTLQPQVNLLDQFVIQQETIPDLQLQRQTSLPTHLEGISEPLKTVRSASLKNVPIAKNEHAHSSSKERSSESMFSESEPTKSNSPQERANVEDKINDIIEERDSKSNCTLM